MKTIIAFFGIMLLWGNAPVLAADCPAGQYSYLGECVSSCPKGTYINSTACTVCGRGFYSDSVNANSCKSCQDLAPYTDTWSGNTAGNHDDAGDCLIQIQFHGKGGKYKNAAAGALTENAPVGAHYSAQDSYAKSCSLTYNGPAAADKKTDYLCTRKRTKFKIAHPTTTEVWSRTDHEFAGWYKTEDLTGDPVSKDEEFDTPQDFYAKWCKTKNADDGNWVAQDGKCVCKQGYKKNDAGTQCVKCAGAYTTTAAAGSDVCVCDLGYRDISTTAGTVTCEACPTGQTTYTPGEACSPIKEFKFSGTEVWKWPSAVSVGAISSSIRKQ